MSNGAFAMGLMCRELYQIIEEHAYNMSRNKVTLSPSISTAFSNLCKAVKELDVTAERENG